MSLEQNLLALGAAEGAGLTKALNRLHDEADSAPEVTAMRAELEAVDAAVAAAYGWSDLDLDEGFHDTRQGVRYTVAPDARGRALELLLALNHERHAAEVAAGPRAKRAAVGRSKSSPEQLF